MLSQEVRKMIINNVIGNFVGHAGITYWVKYKLEGIEAGGATGYIGDFLVTGFMFCGILAAIFIFMYRSKARKGQFQTSEIPSGARESRLPVNPWTASLVIGGLGLICAALPLAVFLGVAGLVPLSPLAVSLSKGIWAAIAAAFVVRAAIYHGVRTANLG